MFTEKLENRILELECRLEQRIKEINEIHKVCGYCGITGHKVDMIASYDDLPNKDWVYYTVLSQKFYHKDCYAKKFNKHLCPCGCGKWIDNKKNRNK